MKKKWCFRLISKCEDGKEITESVHCLDKEATYEEFCTIMHLDPALAEEQIAEKFGFYKVELF